MQIGRQVRVHAGSGCAAGDPNKALFTATLAQNAALNGSLLLPEGLGAGRAAQAIVRSIQVVSVDNLAWEFWFWATSGFQSGHPDQDAFRGYKVFAATDGKQIAAAGNYYYHADGLGILYEDDDGVTATPPVAVNAQVLDPAWRNASNGKTGAYLNVTLINRSAGAKTANGWFDLVVCLEPTLGH